MNNYDICLFCNQPVLITPKGDNFVISNCYCTNIHGKYLIDGDLYTDLRGQSRPKNYLVSGYIREMIEDQHRLFAKMGRVFTHC